MPSSVGAPLLRVVALLALVTASAAVTVTPVSEASVPASVNGDVLLDAGAGEQFDLDVDAMVAYIVGETGVVNVMSYADPSNPVLELSFEIDSGATDVEVCGGVVAVGMAAATGTTDPGKIDFYQAWTQENGMPKLYEVTTGPLPDMLHFSYNCTTMVVANEGEAQVVNGDLVNPAGSISVLTWSGSLTEAPNQVILNFDAFSGEELFKADGTGVLWSYRPDNAVNGESSFQQDLEPEYVAFNDDASMAYVILQENNAVAFVSLGETPEVKSISPLGLKSWENLSIDASNKDGMVNMHTGYKIHGAYQPDTIKTFSVDGKTYMVTANEGDAKEYISDDVEETEYWVEEMRGADMAMLNFSSSVSQETKDQLADETALGRLKFLFRHGHDENGDMMNLIAMGGRSVAIFEMTESYEAKLVWDSGDELEAEQAKIDPSGSLGRFNSDQLAELDETMPDGFDGRSDDKGVETETVDIAMCGGSKLLFVGNERTSTLNIYDITDFPGTNPQLLENIQLSNPSDDLVSTWQELFDSKTLGAIDPESMKYVPINEDEGHLFIAGAVSGTLSAYHIDCSASTEMQSVEELNGDSASSPLVASSLLAAVLTMAAALFH